MTLDEAIKHAEEVEQFEKAMEEWVKQREQREAESEE